MRPRKCSPSGNWSQFLPETGASARAHEHKGTFCCFKNQIKRKRDAVSCHVEWTPVLSFLHLKTYNPIPVNSFSNSTPLHINESIACSITKLSTFSSLSPSSIRQLKTIEIAFLCIQAVSFWRLGDSVKDALKSYCPAKQKRVKTADHFIPQCMSSIA